MLVEKRIGTLPVLDEHGRMIGLVQMRDLIELVMPDFLRLVEDFNFVTDFGAIETRIPSPEVLALPITTVMQPPIFVEENSGLLRAFSVLHQKKLHDLPVVDSEGRLIGIASRVDIGILLLGTWTKDNE
jgi:CBS-domain-containing membrane protein